MEGLADAFYAPVVPVYMCCIPWRGGGADNAVRQGEWKG